MSYRQLGKQDRSLKEKSAWSREISVEVSDWYCENRWTTLRRRIQKKDKEQGLPWAAVLRWEKDEKEKLASLLLRFDAVVLSCFRRLSHISPACTKEKLKWYSQEIGKVPVATSYWKPSPQLFSIPAKTSLCPSGYDINILQSTEGWDILTHWLKIHFSESEGVNFPLAKIGNSRLAKEMKVAHCNILCSASQGFKVLKILIPCLSSWGL